MNGLTDEKKPVVEKWEFENWEKSNLLALLGIFELSGFWRKDPGPSFLYWKVLEQKVISKESMSAAL